MQVLIPKFESFTKPRLQAMEREFRFGSHLKEYVDKERRDTWRRMRRTGMRWKDRSDPKSRRFGELELEGVIDSRTYFRWLQTDPDFWRDEGNWKRFARDNPEVTPWK